MEPFSIGRIFTLFAREGVGNPSKELAEQEKYLRDHLSKLQNGTETNGIDVSEVPITSAVVFLNEAPSFRSTIQPCLPCVLIN